MLKPCTVSGKGKQCLIVCSWWCRIVLLIGFYSFQSSACIGFDRELQNICQQQEPVGCRGCYGMRRRRDLTIVTMYIVHALKYFRSLSDKSIEQLSHALDQNFGFLIQIKLISYFITDIAMHAFHICGHDFYNMTGNFRPYQ